ncbi:hypothetical protein QTL95_18015 [Rhizobium sp. S152]|nr:hypothetical protein [Rhizobium sp. S152]MDM9627791.1 hypothetical protein [Rhizobium sp. S152]
MEASELVLNGFARPERACAARGVSQRPQRLDQQTDGSPIDIERTCWWDD